MCALAVVFAAAGAAAAPIFTATPVGDWFDGASWSGGTAPAATDAPVVDNGGTAIASSSSPLDPGAGTAIEVQSLAVGSRLDASAPADSSGAVELQDIDLALAGNLWVGADESSSAGTVSGSLALLGGDQTAGNLTGAEAYVGVLLLPIPDVDSNASSAVGSLAVGGDLDVKRRLQVGVAGGSSAAASGVAEIGGDVRVFAEPHPEAFAGVALVDVGTSGVLGTPAELTTGALSIAGNLEAVYVSGGNIASSLTVGSASGQGNAAGRVEIGGDVLGFQGFAVGLATAVGAHDSPGGETSASGELHVAGTLGEAPIPGGVFVLSSVGETRVGPFGGSARAEGIATIGHLGSRLNVNVGVAGGGPAVGSLEIGSGNLLNVTVGQTSGDFDAHGTLVTGGGLTSAMVGVSQHLSASPPPRYHTGDAIGSISAGGFVRTAIVGLVSSDGTAWGELDVEGVRAEGLSIAGQVHVGINGVGAGIAEGSMRVRSGGIFAQRVHVGVTHASGSATGLLESTGDVTSASLSMPDGVGYARAQATGHADGTWILHEGTFTSRRLVVGLSEGAGTATGRLVLDHMHVDVDDLTLGDGATVELQIQSLLSYSAIEAGIAKLDGDLRIVFAGPAQNAIYDLLVSGGPDGITGEFDSVSLSATTIGALASDQHVSWGIESVPFGETTREVFRMHVVPEPASASLLAFGLLGVGIRCRRA